MFWVFGFWYIGVIGALSSPVLSSDMVDADEAHQRSQMSK